MEDKTLLEGELKIFCRGNGQYWITFDSMDLGLMSYGYEVDLKDADLLMPAVDAVSLHAEDLSARLMNVLEEEVRHRIEENLKKSLNDNK